MPRWAARGSGNGGARRLLLIGCLALLISGAAAPARGAARPRHEAGAAGCAGCDSAVDYGGIEPAVCAGCVPPLDYGGGPVMAEHSPDGLVVVPIYWVPRASRYAFAPGFESTVNRFIADVAAASGKTDNVFSVATEYYGEQFGVRGPVRYRIRAGTPVIDTDAFPSSGCTPQSGYTACVTDSQLRAELVAFTRRRGLATDLGHVYPVFFPPGVETTNADGTNSVDDFCGYHLAFQSGGHEIVYTNQPTELSGCGAGQAPSGNLAADTVIGILSHELIEVMTDPLTRLRAWDDHAGYEIADLCNDTFGRPLGSTSTSNPGGSEYNQIINGDKYYLPEEFSNFAYERFGPDRGCVLSERAAHSASAAATGRYSASPQTFVIDATPTALAADGTATAEIAVTASDTAGNGLADDRIHFDVNPAAGAPACGTLSTSDVTTGRDGQATVIYTASRQAASCWVSATDDEGGRSAQALIYQGAAAATRPQIAASFPKALQAGGPPVTFTLRASNRSSDDIQGALMHFIAFRGQARARRVTAEQIRLSYSATGPKGAFIPVALVGSTADGEVIEGYIGPLQGTMLPAEDSRTLTLRVSLAGTVPVSKLRPLLVFQTFLEQTDSASGSDLSVADTGEGAVMVPTKAAVKTSLDVEIAAAAVFAALAVLSLVAWGRRRDRRRSPAA